MRDEKWADFYGSGLEVANVLSGPCSTGQSQNPTYLCERLGSVVSKYAQEENKTRFNESKSSLPLMTTHTQICGEKMNTSGNPQNRMKFLVTLLI